MSKTVSNVFIPSAKIADPASGWNGKEVALLIEKGIIKKIGSGLKAPKGAALFSAKNLHVSPGWMDLLASLGEPGYEYKEDLESGLSAAAAGGFTGVMPASATYPVADNRSTIEYLLNNSRSHIVNVFPCGALTKQLEGEELAEMSDMKQGGAFAFGDHKSSIGNPGLLKKGLLYAKIFDGVIMHFPYEKSIAAGGQMNEGVMSTRLGLKAIPSLAEEMIVERDIQIANYTGHRLHFSLISAPNSVKRIREARKKNDMVSCGVSSYHLLLNEEKLETFDSNFKVMPPLRTREDISVLIRGLKDGTIDVIVSDHSPENIENKNCEFDLAAFGVINLETSFAAANTALRKHLPIAEIVGKMCHNPRKILGLPIPEIKEGAKANLTFFDPDLKWTYEASQVISKSSNSPFFGESLTGKALGIYNNGQFLRND